MAITTTGRIAPVRPFTSERIGNRYTPAYSWIGFQRVTGDATGLSITVQFSADEQINDNFVWSLEGASFVYDLATNHPCRVQVNMQDVALNKFVSGVSLAWGHTFQGVAMSNGAVMAISTPAVLPCPLWVPSRDSSASVLMEINTNSNGALFRFLCWGYLWDRGPYFQGLTPMRP